MTWSIGVFDGSVAGGGGSVGLVNGERGPSWNVELSYPSVRLTGVGLVVAAELPELCFAPIAEPVHAAASTSRPTGSTTTALRARRDRRPLDIARQYARGCAGLPTTGEPL